MNPDQASTSTSTSTNNTTTTTTTTSFPSSPPSSNNILKLDRFPHLTLHLTTPKGRGVFTTTAIPIGTTIDTSPILLLSPLENAQHISQTALYHYTYNWPASDPKAPTPAPAAAPAVSTPQQAVVLGLGSMFNHSTRDQNVGWTRDVARQVIVYRASRDIRAGEELCISYGDRLTFVDADREGKMVGEGGEGEEGEEEEDGMLGRIEV